ncbi:MAG: hypothetical protein QY317_16605 [Candidatus Jettenia caeni]|nr:MAG: hypothetical protein QY317_16605 [Candidatus Jettenia caeni]
MAKNIITNGNEGNGNEPSVVLGLSQNIEIKELQQKVLELVKLINTLKQKTELALQELHFQVKDISKELAKLQEHPCCTKAEDITRINLFLAKLEGLDLSNSLEKMSDKITGLDLKITTNQTKLTTLFAVASILIAIASIVVPIFFR